LNHGSTFVGLHIEVATELGQSLPHSGEANAASEISAKQAIPGLGPFIAAGPIMAGLAGLGVGGAVGGLTGALIGAGIPEFEAKRYEGRLQKGGIPLSVHRDTSEEIKRAKDVLKATGAEDVTSTGEASVDRDAKAARTR
jgi:hypothetical protein